MSGLDTAKRLLPAGLRGRLNEILAPVRSYRLARRVCRAYSDHHTKAQARYRADGHSSGPLPSLQHVGVRVLTGDSSSAIALPPDYDDLVGRMQRDLAERLAWSRNSTFYPCPPYLADRTEDIEEVKRGEVLTLALKQHLDIDGLESLCERILPEVERAIYGSYVLVDKVYVLRTMAGRHRDQSSWLWHYDEHPVEILKLMIYLTDVDEHTAPFTYLSTGVPGKAVMGTNMPLYGQSRIPSSTMASYFAKGCRPQPVTGPRGTMVLFNDNIIHRATFAEGRHRDALTLQLRPCSARRRPYIGAGWTGSFPHRDFNRDPEQVEPQVR